MVPEYVIDAYRQPAQQVIYALNGNPFEPVAMPDGTQRPLWFVYATRMHELHLMLQALRSMGACGF